MVWLLDFEELAECFGVSLDMATRIAERDLPIVPLYGRGERPKRAVDLEALYLYIDKIAIADSDMAAEIKARVLTARLRRIEQAAEARGPKREVALPELVRVKRRAAKTQHAPGTPRPPARDAAPVASTDDDEGKGEG